MSETPKITITQLEDGTYGVAVNSYTEIGPETWDELPGEVDPLKVTTLEVTEVQKVKKRTFSVFANLERLIYHTQPVALYPETIEGCYRMRKIHLPLSVSDRREQMRVHSGVFYGFKTLLWRKDNDGSRPFLWKEQDQWIDGPIEPEDTAKRAAQDRLVIDHGYVTNFEQVCCYWMGANSGFYNTMDAYTRLYRMLVPGFPKEQGVTAKIVKRPAGASMYNEDPEHWMQSGTLNKFLSYAPAILIPGAEKVGQGISLTVDFAGSEYAVTGWGRSSDKTLKEFLLPQLCSGRNHKNAEITKIDVLKFEIDVIYDWSGDIPAVDFDAKAKDAEWEDIQEVTMLRFLCYVMSGEVDPTRRIKVY